MIIILSISVSVDVYATNEENVQLTPPILDNIAKYNVDGLKIKGVLDEELTSCDNLLTPTDDEAFEKVTNEYLKSVNFA